MMRGLSSGWLKRVVGCIILALLVLVIVYDDAVDLPPVSGPSVWRGETADRTTTTQELQLADDLF